MLVISLFRAALLLIFALVGLQIYPLTQGIGPIVSWQVAFVGVAAYFFIGMWGESRIVSYFNPEETDNER